MIMFPEILGTHLIDLDDERLSRPWSHSVVLNTGGLNWESSSLTTRPCHNSVLPGVEVNHSKLAVPPKVLLNKNNITTAQFVLPELYRQDEDEENPYKLLQSPFGKYYSLLHNGVFIRSLSSAWNLLNIPWSLSEIEGRSLNASKLVQHIIQTISQVKPTKNNAYKEVPKLLNSLLEKNHCYSILKCAQLYELKQTTFTLK